METTIMESQMDKKMENKMETTIMENQVDKKMENEMKTVIIMAYCKYREICKPGLYMYKYTLNARGTQGL